MAAIHIENLVKSYGWLPWRKKIAVDHLFLNVEEGELFGFLGPNGAGKTTTIKVLLGLIRPTSGKVLVFGRGAENVEVKSRIGFLSDSPNFYPHISGLDFLLFCGKLHHIPRAERRKLANKLLEMVGLTSAAKQHVRGYSRGMKQRLGIAQTLIHNPDLIILDEPMNGLDPLGRRDVKQLMLQLKADGKTVFFSSHIIPDVEEMCDRVGILNRGRLLAEGEVKSLLGSAYDAIIASNMAAIAEVAAEKLAIRTRRDGERWIFPLVVDDPEYKSKVENFISENGGQIETVSTLSDTLEDAFLRTVAEDEQRRREDERSKKS